MLKPKLFSTLKDYTLSQFLADAMSGVIVGVIAIPLAIAFAIASGVSPELGLITAIIGGFIVSVLGGSRVQIAGPTGAFIVIVYDVVQKHGVEGLYLATIMGGVLLLLMGLARLGSAIKFIPYPVVVGFTSGIAIIIFSSQVKDFFGLQMDEVPASFLAKWSAYASVFYSINGYALLVSAGTLVTIILWKKVSQRIPGTLVALVLFTCLAHIFGLPVETIGSRFGEIPHTFSKPSFPPINIELLKELSSPALTIALLAGIESLLSAVVADGMIGGRHRSDMELIAQGTANIVAPLFGGIPVTGAIARTAANINNGGRTPVAGIVHSLFLLLVMLFLGKWVSYIPLACLAAILTIVAYNMSEWHSFIMVLRSPRSDVLVLLVTFLLTVLIDLTVAIQTGVVLAVFLFIRRMSLVSNVEVISREFNGDQDTDDDPDAINKKVVPEGVEVYEVEGPFFFGASYKFMEAMDISAKKSKIRIIRMRQVPSIDATGLHTLKQQFRNCKKHNIAFIISGVNPQPMAAMEKSGLLDEIGRANVCKHIDIALDQARRLLRREAVDI